MLIFFIVTSSFIRESGVEVQRPQAETANPQDKGNILIAVTADGQIWMDKQSVDIRSVRAHVERMRVEQPEGAVV
ncbi:biopolymer transporter ExbD, partial [Escherichia coli]|uniref:ExbD/TolR family protein n=1 Tax=Escherichia coli TaxID=562 RepID=UPI0028DFA393